MNFLRHGRDENDTLLGRVKRVISRLDTEEEVPREESNSERRMSMTDFAFETGLTPEEYIVQLLTAQDGEMRQQDIIARTGWSRSSVSRLLGRMEATGQIVRLRLGAGNVVYLSETVPQVVRQFETVPMAQI